MPAILIVYLKGLQVKMDISGIEYLGLKRVLKRGSGEIIAEREQALLIRDSVSGAYLVAGEDETTGLPVLDRFIGWACGLLMTSDEAVGNSAFIRYGFSEKLLCYQFAYFGKKPADDKGLFVRTADASDLNMLSETYKMISPEELEKVVKRQSVLLGYDRGRPVGFIGEHLEGSMAK